MKNAHSTSTDSPAMTSKIATAGTSPMVPASSTCSPAALCVHAFFAILEVSVAEATHESNRSLLSATSAGSGALSMYESNADADLWDDDGFVVGP